MPNSASKAKPTHRAILFSLSVATTTTTKKKPHTKIKGLKFDSVIILLNKIKQFLSVLHLSLIYTNRKNVGFETSVL